MVVIKKDIVYDKSNNLKTDIYFPNNTDSQTKILIFWHGGGWFRGSKDDVKDYGVAFANAGFMTLIPDYRLAPKNTFPATHNDSKNLVDWLLRSQYTDEGDIKNIVQIGASVGGTLALYIAGLYGFPTVTWSAPVDFSKWMATHPDVKPSKDAKNELGLNDPTAIKESFYKFFTQTYAGNSDELVKMDASSYNYDKLSHLFMINSAKELNPLKSVLNFVDFLAENNHEVQLLVIKGTGHAMDYAKNYIDESLDYLYQTIKGAKE